jgi:hypothetical protein
MAVTMNVFRHVMHGAQGRINHVSEVRLLKGSRVPHEEEYLKLIFKSLLLPYAIPIQVPNESVCNSSGLLEESPKCYAVGLQTSESNSDVASAL